MADTNYPDSLQQYRPLNLREHFCIRRFTFSHPDPRAFKTSWFSLPVFVAYRVFVALYLAGWTLANAVYRMDTDAAHWLIYITNWSSVFQVVTSLVASLVTTVYCASRTSFWSSYGRKRWIKRPTSIQQYQSVVKIHWTLQVFWLMYITAQTISILVCIGYWTVVYEPCGQEEDNRETDLLNVSSNGSGVLMATENITNENCGADVLSIHAHGINGAIAIVDIILCLVPFNAFHLFYPCLFTTVFVIFSGIYYAADGTNEMGDSYIYSLLNYGDNPLISGVSAILLVFVPALVYIIPFTVALIRDKVYMWILNYCLTHTNHCCSCAQKRQSRNRDSIKKLPLNLEHGNETRQTNHGNETRQTNHGNETQQTNHGIETRQNNWRNDISSV